MLVIRTNNVEANGINNRCIWAKGCEVTAICEDDAEYKKTFSDSTAAYVAMVQLVEIAPEVWVKQ